jgi:putative nucleotidyltransferase with HDIG domain
MPESLSLENPASALSMRFNSIPAKGQIAAEPDWERTISNLMTLAKGSNNAYEYEKAVDYLNTLENIGNSKELPGFSIEMSFELHREKGKALAAQGRYEAAINEYQKILKHCRDFPQLSIKAETFTQIGQLLAKQADHDRALGYLQRAIGAYRRLNDKKGICRALRNLGVVYVELGEFEEAELNYHEAIEIARESGEEILYADLINNLGAIMNMKGNWRRALDLYRESLKIYHAHEQTRKSAYTENNLAITLAEQNLKEEAFDYFIKAYSTAKSIQDASLTLIVNINLADMYLKKGDLDNARDHCHKAEKYLIESKRSNGHLVETKKIAGKIAMHEDRPAEALVHFNRAIEISRKIGAQFLEAEVLLERGILHHSMEKNIDALTDLEASYHIYTSVKAEGKREQTEEVINSIESLYLQIFDDMAREVDHKDRYTKGHSDRVATLALLMGKELGLTTHTLKTIVAASLLHDLGKVQIPDKILKKAGKLSDEEFHSIRKHPELGVELLRGKEFPWDIKPLILYHHEKIDGKGYPLGLKGEDIPMGARIICIADVFDALTSDRVYRPAFDTTKALRIMEMESGQTFDPVLLKCFINMIHLGKADLVINSRTSEDEMYSIWSQCTLDEKEQSGETEQAEVVMVA